MNLILVLSGVSMTTFFASGLFFLKFYRASKDRFFLNFCLAFWLLAIERIVLIFGYNFDEARTPLLEQTSSVLYLMRLAAFLLILAAIFEKNIFKRNKAK